MSGVRWWDLQPWLRLLAGDGALRQWLLSYLALYVFCLGLALGSLGLLLLQPLTGGAWMRTVRPPLTAAARTLPLLAILSLPLLAGMTALYPWALSADPALQVKAWYLNGPFFLLRGALYFVIWLALTWTLERRRRQAQRRADPADVARLRRLCAGGLLLYALSVTFAAIDWIMTLTPQWTSSTFGLLVGVGWLLSALALATACAVAAARRGGPTAAPERWQDLGSLLLMLLLAWAYLALMQYLTIWAGNLPREIRWYLPRLQTGWRWLALFLIVGGFIIPFALLLFRRVKRDPPLLGGVAALLLATQFVYAIWLTIPSLRTEGFALYWTDALALVIPGGLWLVMFLRRWRRPPVPVAGAAQAELT